MNCTGWEERLALYAGGDLVPAEVDGVQRHVRECTGCSELLESLQTTVAVLRESPADTVDAAHYAAVRTRVRATLEQSRRRRTWAYSLAAAALVVACALPVLHHRAPVVVPAATTATVSAPVAPVVPSPAVPPRRRVRRQPAPKTIAVKTEPVVEPMVVKLITDDPDIIIYWITDTKGE